MEGNFRSVQHAQQFGLATRQAPKELVEIAIARADREDPIEPSLEAKG